MSAADLNIDAGHMEIYVTPYYNSNRPTIDVGRFSAGLASADEPVFLRTILKMKNAWQELSFAELYVAAVRLYDLGYRRDSVYWYYSAEYRGRLFTALLDQERKGSIGDPGYEMLSSQTAFYRLAGPYINGYGFGDLDALTEVLRKVQKRGESIPNMRAIYPNVSFKNPSEWEALNAGVNSGMDKLVVALREKKDSILRQRIDSGVAAKFSILKNKDFPAEYKP